MDMEEAMSPETAYGVLALILVVFLAVATAKAGSEKGGNAVLWFIVGLLVPGLALVVALFLDDPPIKDCPRCAKRVRRDARICGYCSYQFTVRDNLRGW
jgi:hypothetical protein